MRMRAAPRRSLLATTLVLLLAGTAPAQDPPDGLKLPDGPRRSRALQALVDTAIDHGVAWLRKAQAPDGAFTVDAIRFFHVDGVESLGPTALGIYTLRACGAGFDDPAVARGLARLREIYDRRRKMGVRGLDNYGVSLTVLALEAHYHGDASADADADRYGNVANGRRRIPEPDLEWIRELTAWLVAAQTKDGAFSYWSPAGGNQQYDHSNMQYSLLALKAARRMGVRVPTGVWRRALEHLLASQESDGPPVERHEHAGIDDERYGGGRRKAGIDRARGWGYVARSPATGSMTAGGVSSLVICRSELIGTDRYPKRLDEAAAKGIHDGLAWLGHHFTVERNPGPPGAPAAMELWHYYFLYGLERAGVLAGVAYMADHDWYLEGARFLVDAQRDDGGWFGREALANLPQPGMGPTGRTASFLDTCFALLFLKRATFRVTRGAVATVDEAATLDLSGADDLDDATHRGVFALVFDRYVRVGDPERASVATDFVRLGTRAVPLLILELESAEEDRRAAAIEALATLTGARHGYLADAEPDMRARAIELWEDWWFRNREAVQPSLSRGRFEVAGEGAR